MTGLKKSDSGFSRPFENLRRLLEGKTFPMASFSVEKIPIPVDIDLDPDHPEYDHTLFMKAMADVTPLPKEKYAEADAEPRPPDPHDDDAQDMFRDTTEHESMLRLKNLVENGEGFVVAHTPEYIEGSGYCDNPELIDRLHRGDFSIQGYVDLHGLGVEGAQEVFDQFIKESISTGKRAVLVVHGRGLSSPRKPVLKTKVQDWLTRGPWRKWIIAFSSAQSCDGGAGATYVLLRRQPFTKRLRKKLRKRRRRS